MRVTRKGQVTIPKPLRDRAGLSPGTEVEFAYRDGDLLLRKRGGTKVDDKHIRALRAHLESIRGSADSGLTADEIMDMTRGPYDDIDGR